MLSVTSETSKSNNSNNNANTSENNQFPTVGLKSLLQNSDLLELLLKPLETKSAADEQKSSLQLTSQEDSKRSPTHSLTEANLKYNSLFDIDILDECLESKANKIENDDATSKYGNAFFGQSLWEKSEIYQSDKMGVKFEYLEVDDFLNENGLNEADVEFLDQLQKYESTDANKSVQGNTTQTQTSSSPFAPSPSSHSSTSSTAHSLKSLLDATTIPSSGEKARINHSASSSNSLNKNSSLNLNMNHAKKNEKNFGNWNSNDLSIGSMSDYRSDDDDDDDDELNDSKKLTTEELKLQPLMKKSKKNSLENMMMTNNKKSFNKNNNINNSSSLDYSLVGLAEIDIENDLLNSDSDESDLDLDLDDDLDKSISKKVSKKSRKKFVPDELKDDKYWARRRKNNVAAKRSRDARRMKENQIAVRATYLERENDLLRKQLEDFKRENKVLKIKLARFEASPNSENITGK